MNLFPVAAALAVLLLVVVGFFGLMGAMEPQTEEEVPVPMIGNQPEFFSTIRPETLNIAEVDLEDDPAKAAEVFENTLFIGDGQMAWLKTQQLADENVGAYLEKALFLTANSYSWQAMQDEFNGGALTFNLYGEYVSLNSALAKTGAKRVVILLGRNDLIMELPETAVGLAQNALRALKQACPNTEILVMTMTPNTAESGSIPSNSAIAAFNEGLRTVCAEESGITLVDAGAIFPAEGLPENYCADPAETGRRLNGEGAMLLVTELLNVLTAPEATAVPEAMPTAGSAPVEQPEQAPQASVSGDPQAAGRASLTN